VPALRLTSSVLWTYVLYNIEQCYLSANILRGIWYKIQIIEFQTGDARHELTKRKCINRITVLHGFKIRW
jgi:hypothetical protein